MKRLSLKNRIFYSIAAVIIFFAALSVLFVEFYIKDLLHEESIEDGQATASMLAAQVSQFVYNYQYPEIDSSFQSLVAQDNEIEYVFLLQNGKVLSKAARRSFPEGVFTREYASDRPDYSTFTYAGKKYYDFSLPLGKDDLGFLRVGLSERLDSTLTVRLVSSLVLIALVLMAVSLLLANFLANRLSLPISHLTETASRVTSGDFSMLAAVEGEDEIGELAASFNEMLHALRLREQELRAANVDLEAVNVRLHEYIEELDRTRAELVKTKQDTAVTATTRAFMHHLRQPLTYLLMSTEMLLEEAGENAELKGDSYALKIRAIEEAARQISALLRKFEKLKSYRPMEYDEYSKIIDIDA